MSNDLISFDSPPNLISFNDDEASVSSRTSGISLNQTPKRVRTGNLLDRSPFQDLNETGDQCSTTTSDHSPTTSTSSCTNLDSSHDDLALDANNQTLEASAVVVSGKLTATPVKLQQKISVDDSSSLSDMNLESLGILSDIFTRSDLDTTGNEDTWLCSPEELRSNNQREPLSVRKELQDMTNTSQSRDLEKQKVVDWLKLDSDVDMRKLLVHLTDLCDRRIRSRNSALNNSAKSAQQPEPFKQLDQLLSSLKAEEKPIKKDHQINILPATDQSPATNNNINNETVIASSSHSELLVDKEERMKSKVKSIEKSPEPRKPEKIATRSLDFAASQANNTSQSVRDDVQDKIETRVVVEAPEELKGGPDAMSLSDKDIYTAMITLVRNSVGKDWPHEKITDYATQVIERVTGRNVITEAIASKYATYKKNESSRPATPTTWKNIASNKQAAGSVVGVPASSSQAVNKAPRTASVTRTNTVTLKSTSSNLAVANPTSTTKRRPVMAYGSQRSLTASVVSSKPTPFQPHPSVLPSQSNFKNSVSSYQMKHKQSTSNISDVSSISSGYASNNTSPNGNWSNMSTSSSLHQMTSKRASSSVHQSRVVVSTPRTHLQASTSKPAVIMPPPSPRSSRPRVAQSPSMSTSRKSTSSTAYQDVSLTRKSFIPVPAPFTNALNKSQSVTRQCDVSPIRNSQIVDTSRVKGVRASSNGWWLNDPEIF